MTDILDAITETAREKLLFLPHAIEQLARAASMISPDEVERALTEGEIIEAREVDLIQQALAALDRQRQERFAAS